MRIDDIESKKLLPNWAHGADWIQAAFDQIVLMCAGRLPAIDAPLTMQAIQCLTDEELREWYARFGVVEYYPDLNRETREKMLYWLARLYRYLGTPHAIRVLCDYIYNDLPLDVTVIDNLAFDGETLVDPTLLDLFDVEIDAGSAGISPTQAYRLVNNILRIARNSQTLRKIIYDYASDIDVNCGACSYGGDVCIDYSDNDELARDVTPPTPVLPTVRISGQSDRDHWFYTNDQASESTYLTLGANSSQLLFSNTASYTTYNSSRVYSVYKYQKLTTDAGTQGLTVIPYSFYGADRIGIQNSTSSSIDVTRIRIYNCDDLSATVVTVYNSSNAAYNAFKYTVSGTDYYYVLDGTQTDWTDDLSSIGYHIVLPHDDATGTVSSIALPTAHSGSYTGVSFDSLRYYAKGTISNTGSAYGPYFGGTDTYYYGTVTWVDESIGDLSDKIAVNPTSSNTKIPQTVFRIIFINSNSINGQHPYDTNDSSPKLAQITEYIYNNGVHSITFYINTQWYNNASLAGRIQFRYLDGTTTFSNLNAFDLINVSSGTLSKITTTDRYDMYNVWNGDITIHAEYTE